MSPLMAQSGHCPTGFQCLLLGVKRTLFTDPSCPSSRQVDSPRVLPMYDIPKNVYYPVSCYRDGGENADGAEPAIARAKQHLSESTDTKTECRDAHPRIPDARRGREADRGCEAGAPRAPGCDADP